jgi:5-methylcytosine-specific restriction endonuclease McrA
MTIKELSKQLSCTRQSIYAHIGRLKWNHPAVHDVAAWENLFKANKSVMAQRNRVPGSVRKCINCGEDVHMCESVARIRKPICSKACRKKLLEKKHTRNCLECGKSFINDNHKIKCCCRKCGHTHQGKGKIKSASEKANASLCAICGLQIFGASSKTCGSEWCVHEYKRIKYGTIEERKKRERESNKRTNEKFRDKYNAKAREKYNNSPIAKAKHRSRKHKRKALMINATIGTDYAIAYRVILAKAKKCHWCGRVISKGDLDVDHVLPLSRGGAHSAFNLVASCSFCNRSRGAKTTQEYLSIKQPELMFA